LLPTVQRNPMERPDEEFSYVDIASVDNEAKTIVATKRIVGADAPSRARKVIQAGDVIVSTVRPNLNTVALVPDNLDNQICSTGFSVLRPSAKTLGGYLFAFARSSHFIDYLVTKTTGANYPAVNDGEIKDVPLPLPPLAEQERIVKLLDEADELRKLRAKADCRTDALIPSLFHEMFGEPDSNPKGWPVKTLKQIATRLHQGINTAADKVQYQTSGYAILQAKHITSDCIENEDARFVSDGDYAKYKDRYSPSSGNILFTNIGTIGKSVVVDQASDFLVAWNIFLIALQPDVSPIFINAFLKLLDKRGYFTGRNTGSATQFVSKSQLQAIKIPVPPPLLQKEFAARVADIRAVQAEQAASRRRLDDLFQSMLHRAFQGEL
jgi:type I restriction enzyme S subunit